VPEERCSIRVAILDADGKVRRRLTDWRSQSKAAHSATWDGKGSSPDVWCKSLVGMVAASGRR